MAALQAPGSDDYSCDLTCLELGCLRRLKRLQRPRSGQACLTPLPARGDPTEITNSSRPGPKAPMSDLKSWIEERRIGEVECLVPDMNGVLRGKVLPAGKLLQSARDTWLAAPALQHLRPDGHRGVRRRRGRQCAPGPGHGAAAGSGDALRGAGFQDPDRLRVRRRPATGWHAEGYIAPGSAETGGEALHRARLATGRGPRVGVLT